MSAIGVGTWQFGSREWGYGKEYADRDAAAIVHRALELGVNLFDTAEMYAFGESERILGRALLGHRDEAFIATKLFPVLPLPQVATWRGRASRERLGVSTIDLYQLHWPNPLVPLGVQAAGLRALQAAGVVRHVGVSNYGLARWKAIESALGGPVISNQVSYSLVERGPERELVPWAGANDHIVIAYSPLAQGLLSGRFDGSNPPTGVRATNALFLPENLERATPLIEVLRSVAADHDAKPSQVALAWLIRRKNVVAIPGASSVAQLEQNVAAADIELSDEQDRELTETAEAFRPMGGAGALPALARQRLRR